MTNCAASMKHAVLGCQGVAAADRPHAIGLFCLQSRGFNDARPFADFIFDEAAKCSTAAALGFHADLEQPFTGFALVGGKVELRVEFEPLLLFIVVCSELVER